MSNLFFESIREKLRRILKSRNRSEMANRFDTSDVVQESAIQVWQHVTRHELTESKVDTRWLRSVAVGHYCKLLRFHLAAKRNVNLEARVACPNVGVATIEPCTAIEQRERAIHLLDCIENLEPVPKQIVVARFFREQSFAQISRELGITVHGARKLLADAVNTLQSTI